MIVKMVGKALAMLAVAAWFMTANVADGATNGGSLSGTVVHARGGKGVSQARVKVAGHKHHHKKHKKHKKGKKAGAKLKHAKAHVGHHKAAHASAITGSGGQFTLRNVGSGTVTVVAHKRGMGSGRATVTAGSGNFAIVLHKKHHRHSGLRTAHAVHKAKKKPHKKHKAAMPAQKKLNSSN